MPLLNILICGGGIAGPALARWLVRSGHSVTIVERFPTLRAGGAQIDLRAQGIEAVRRLGVMDAVRQNLVDEAGVQWVDTNNKPYATILANKSGRGAQGPTSEYEIMRGDLVRVLYDATKDDVKYIFGVTVDKFEQDENSVTVFFSDGTSGTYDLLVGADGQGSRIRRGILEPEIDPIRHLGWYCAYFFIDREPGDTNMRMSYLSQRRWTMMRSHNDTQTQAYFMLRDDSEELRNIPRASPEKQKDLWAKRYEKNGWQTQRMIDGMETTDNWYCQEICQVHTDTWSKGRVVLLGDAAHCPSPLTGMGTTSAFCGAYVLAGEITRHSDDLGLAFKNYDDVLRPFANDFQKMSPMMKYAFPETAWGVIAVRWLMWAVTSLQIPKLVMMLSSEEKGGWRLPDYPELVNHKTTS